MDSLNYAQAVSEVIAESIAGKGLTVAATAEKSGIARTTLMRRMDHPEFSPLNVIELAQLAEVLDMRLSSIIRRAEALADSKEGGE